MSSRTSSPQKKTVTIYTDGSCSGNPGPGGWAAVLLYGSQEKVISGGEDLTTNNRMELRAIVEGLRVLTEPVRARIHTDSAYAVNAFEQDWISGWQRRGWKTAGKKSVKNQDLWQALLKEMKRHEVEFVKVKGHADDDLNNRADALAVAAMRLRKEELQGT